MKLFYCRHCGDIVTLRLAMSVRACLCGESWGRYVDVLNVKLGGKAIPIGITNSTFRTALENRPETGLGKNFAAFVIPKQCDTVTYESGD